MPIVVSETSTPKEPIPAGNHVAICYSMVHVGTLTSDYAGTPTRRNIIRITFELPNELREFNGEMKPLVISKKFTLSLFRTAALRQFLESWRGQAFTDDELKGFDVTKVLGAPCMLNVIHDNYNGHGYDKITGVAKIPKGLEVPQRFNPLTEYDVSFHDEAQYQALPKWLQEEIAQSEEWQQRVNPMTDKQLADEADRQAGEQGDDLPF